VRYNLRIVQRLHLILVASGLALGSFVSGCGKSRNEITLGDRITAADTTRYCGLGARCFDPQVIADATGFDVTTFIGHKLQSAHIPAKDLSSYLQALPMEAWPGGPAVIVSLSDAGTDPHAAEQNFNAAQRLCHSMGLDVHVHAGG
jgi:hypothetical protein